MRQKKRKIRTSLMLLSIIPLLGFCIVALVISSGIIYEALENEVEYGLKVLGRTAYQAYDLQYPGDYNRQNGIVCKGNTALGLQQRFVDNIKEISGADATLFYGGIRYLTTIENDDGSRAIGTYAEPKVIEEVLGDGLEYFSDSVLVNGVQYFGYYMPVPNSDESIVGMVFVGRPRVEVMREIYSNILMVVLLAAGTLMIALAVISHFSNKLIYALHLTESFLERIAQGDLIAQIDPYVLERQDEIGEMGHFAVMLQTSIVGLVGKDPLTGLPNRRSCDMVLKSLTNQDREKETVFTVVMADIDHFKEVNDTYGHQAGDEVLKNVAKLMKAHMEHLGFVFRWGGEEFLLIYEDKKEEDALPWLEKLHKDIDAAGVIWNKDKINISMTFGMTDYSREKNLEELIRRADENLYIGKKQGRDQIVGSMT